MDGKRPPLESGARVVIAALVPAAGDEDKPLLESVQRAVLTTGTIVVGTLIQRRGASRSRNPGGAQAMYRRYPMQKATLLGKGKVIELVALVHQSNAEYVLFCNRLTKKQKTTLEILTGATVLSVFSNDQIS